MKETIKARRARRRPILLAANAAAAAGNHAEARALFESVGISYHIMVYN